MLRIGLTGGIGSGKSTVARVFEILGVPVYYADDAAKRLMQENGPLRDQLKAQFSSSIFVGDQLDRSRLAAIVFSDPGKLALLNSLVHPATIADAAGWLQEQEKKQVAYAIKEAALIFESGAEKDLDLVIGVDAPYTLRLERAMKRDGMAEAEIIIRIDRQMAEEKKMALCDFIIHNDEKHLLVPQVLELHARLMAMQAGKEKN